MVSFVPTGTPPMGPVAQPWKIDAAQTHVERGGQAAATAPAGPCRVSAGQQGKREDTYEIPRCDTPFFELAGVDGTGTAGRLGRDGEGSV